MKNILNNNSDLLLWFYLLTTRRMEKLVKLLNEYELKQVENSEGLDVSRVWIMDGTLHYYDNNKDELVFDNIDLLIISARYGFIERLVKNDKIKDNGIKPRKDLVKEIAIVDYKTGKAIGCKNLYSESEQLIMYLAIKDNPIEYLCSILKE